MGSKEKISISIVNQTKDVEAALLGRKSLMVPCVFATDTALLNGETSSSNGPLVPLAEFKFNDNEQKSTRRPQGVAIYNFECSGRSNKYLINSWYFRSNSEWDGNFKLTIADIANKSYFNVVPVKLNDSGKFVHIDSHAGGLTVVDHYLYVASGKSILIFDLAGIYKITGNPDPVIADGEKFIYEYSYMIPMVGKMTLTTKSGAGASYISLTEIESKNYFLLGNFYSTVKAEFEDGGKSMIWLFPVVPGSNSQEAGKFPFATIYTDVQNFNYYQIEPLFPSGDDKGTTVTRIQGALVKDNVLVLNRSYSSETYQLVIIRYANILAETLTQTGYFTGTNKSKHSYDKKNWLEGCEDLEFADNKIWTVTEFNDRSVYSAAYTDIINLIE